MKKRLSICLVFILIFSLLSALPAFALNPDNTIYADRLYQLGLFKGTDNGYDLDKTATRAQAAVMLVRLLGAEQTAQTGNFTHPFTDVPNWAAREIAYLYANNLTKGMTQTTFNPDNLCSGKMYATFALRALEYNDTQGDFNYETSVNDAMKLGLFSSEYEKLIQGNIIRDDMVLLSYNALYSNLKGKQTSLFNKLAAAGAIPSVSLADQNDKTALQSALARSKTLTSIDCTQEIRVATNTFGVTGSQTATINIKMKLIDGQVNAVMTQTSALSTGQSAQTEVYIKDGYIYTQFTLNGVLYKQKQPMGTATQQAPDLSGVDMSTLIKTVAGYSGVLDATTSANLLGHTKDTYPDSPLELSAPVGKNVICDFTISPNGYIQQFRAMYATLSQVSAPKSIKIYYDITTTYNNPGQEVILVFPDLSSYIEA